jgi:hypothetical protein
MKTASPPGQCATCQTDLSHRRREYNRRGEPLCRRCYRKKSQAYEAKRQWSHWRHRIKRILGYTLVAVAVPPVIYFLVHVLAGRQVPPSI